MSYLLLFHCKNYGKNVPLFYVIRTMPILCTYPVSSMYQAYRIFLHMIIITVFLKTADLILFIIKFYRLSVYIRPPKYTKIYFSASCSETLSSIFLP